MADPSPPSDPIVPRDLFLSADLSPENAHRYLERRGFRDPRSADEHLQQLADDLSTRLALGDLAESLLGALTEAPDPDASLVGFCRYVATRVPKSSFVGYLQDDPRALEVLTFLLGASPFLGEVLIRSPEYFHWLQRELDGPAPDAVDYETSIESALGQDTEPRLRLDALKRFRRREMLRIAARDFLGKDTLRASTQQLSDLAGAVADGVIRILREKWETSGTTPPPGSFVILGMGKLGGRELNYSSDIDLVYVYEPDDSTDRSAHERFQRFGRALTTMLGEHTDEGYFYRIDLRLRPMGQRGNVVYSLLQSRQYYETLGETFERFAMIKARPIAGDLELGSRFVEMIQPFVYRRYLDHAAIEELARYKARSDREQAKRDSADRNVKAGRGGIREVELFTQVFQLLYGGTHPELQDPNTITALQTLQTLGLIEEDVLNDLAAAYEFLRKVEHRLQVVQQGQTHTLPGDGVELTITARRLGFADAETFLAALDDHRDKVHAIYANLFERRSDDAEYQGRQLFRLLSGELSDDEAVTHLRNLGFGAPDRVLQVIRSLDDVASLAHSKTSTRNLLANLLATTLEDVADTGAPDTVLSRLEHVVARTRAPAALYRSLLEDAPLRDRLLTTLETGDLFARRLGRYPELLDFLVPASISTDAFRRAIREGLDRIEPGPLADAMDPFRRLKAIEEFKVLVEWVDRGSLPTLTGKLSLLADTALAWAATRAMAELSDGESETGGRWVVVALGKLGGRELTVHSDLDLVFLYDGDPSDSTTYERQQGFVRAIYRLLETQTSEGVAYHVDTRLRPEGKKGALAIPLVAFERYLSSRAERWERMAWTRSRVVAGSEQLASDVQRVVQAFVYGTWDGSMPGYARHIRARMERELSKESDGTRCDFKVGHGGLADIDFLLQLIQIREGATNEAFRRPGTRELLTSLPGNGFIDPDEIERLRDAYAFLRALETVVRIESDTARGWIPTDPDGLEPVVSRLDLEPATGESLLERYREITRDVRRIFERGMTRLEQ